jgi:hypothetical protein
MTTPEEIIKTATVELETSFDGSLALLESRNDPAPAEPDNPRPWVRARVDTALGEYYVYFPIDRSESSNLPLLEERARHEARKLIERGQEPV